MERNKMAGKRDYKQEVLQQLSIARQRGASRGQDEAVAEILGSQVGEVVANLYAVTDDDEALQKAFRLSGLDPKNPYHWRELLTAFAEPLFAGARREHAEQCGRSPGTRTMALVKRRCHFSRTSVGRSEVLVRQRGHFTYSPNWNC
jgi:hypothetical protein